MSLTEYLVVVIQNDGSFGPDDAFLWAAGIASIITIIVALWRPLKAVRRFFRRAEEFLEDWFGRSAEPERGITEVPGVMVRLKSLEDRHIAAKLDREGLWRSIKAMQAEMIHLHSNSATAAKQNEIASQLDEVANRQRQEEIAKQQEAQADDMTEKLDEVIDFTHSEDDT